MEREGGREGGRGGGWGGVGEVVGRRRDREKEIEMGRGKLPFNQETPLIQTELVSESDAARSYSRQKNTILPEWCRPSGTCAENLVEAYG